MEKSIFYCLIRTDKTIHDRQQYNDEPKTKKEFFNWVQEQRDKVEEKTGSVGVVENLKFI